MIAHPIIASTRGPLGTLTRVDTSIETENQQAALAILASRFLARLRKFGDHHLPCGGDLRVWRSRRSRSGAAKAPLHMFRGVYLT